MKLDRAAGVAEKPGLVRGLGLFSAIAVVAGSTIGSGVFLVAADISRTLPTPALALSIWLVAGLISLMGGLAFAELGGMYPGAGGQYVYLREAFGPLPAFLYGWTLFLVIQTGSIAAVSASFALFASGLVPLGPTGMKLVSTVVVGLFTAINLLGVKKGAGVLDVLTSLKVIALLVIVAIALFVPVGPGAGIGWSGSVSGFTFSGYGVALIAAFWAFDGWNNLSFVAGEVINPRRNIPLGVVIGIALVASLYFGVNWAYYHVLPASVVARSDFPASDFARFLGGEGAVRLIVITVALSSLGCLNGLVLSGPRVTYAVAEDGALPEWLGYVHPRFHVPSVALLVQLVWAVLLIWSGRFDQLFTYVVSAAFVFYGLTVAGLLVLRRKRPELPRPYRVPFYPWLPLLYVGFTASFVVNSVVEKPFESLAGLGIVSLGVPGYFYFRWKNRRKRAALSASREAP